MALSTSEKDTLLPSEHLVLEALDHGYNTIPDIKDFLNNRSIFPIELSTSRIYKILQSMERNGLIEIVQTIDDGRMRRYTPIPLIPLVVENKKNRSSPKNSQSQRRTVRS